ncbi:hypothetical protein EWM64_g1633 [Hericium alpestre]|uniref:Hydrophobin n=1 Tax=Hericium alpestre TaxID=135208 RepID=A0A4Z0A6K9_9AGAM|nr:hypothetical protein EWM64_g1633 [Hericium alpestre]
MFAFPSRHILTALALTFVVTLAPNAHAQGNPADMIECDSLTTAAEAAQILERVGIPVPSDPNELVGSRCTQTSTPCDAIPLEAQCQADFCACCQQVIFTGTPAGAVGLNCTQVEI